MNKLCDRIDWVRAVLVVLVIVWTLSVLFNFERQ